MACVAAVAYASDVHTVRQSEVNELRHTVDKGFLRINAQPIKQALGTWVSKWIHLFSSFLSDYVTRRLQWLHDFMEHASANLTLEVGTATPAEREKFLTMLALVRRIRQLQDRVALMTPPLVRTVALLRRHGHSMVSATSLYIRTVCGPACVYVCEGVRVRSCTVTSLAISLLLLSQDMDIGGVPLSTFLDSVPMRWDAVVHTMYKVKEGTQRQHSILADDARSQVHGFEQDSSALRQDLVLTGPFNPSTTTQGVLLCLIALCGVVLS